MRCSYINQSKQCSIRREFDERSFEDEDEVKKKEYVGIKGKKEKKEVIAAQAAIVLENNDHCKLVSSRVQKKQQKNPKTLATHTTYRNVICSGCR